MATPTSTYVLDAEASLTQAQVPLNQWTICFCARATRQQLLLFIKLPYGRQLLHSSNGASLPRVSRMATTQTWNLPLPVSRMATEATALTEQSATLASTQSRALWVQPIPRLAKSESTLCLNGIFSSYCGATQSPLLQLVINDSRAHP